MKKPEIHIVGGGPVGLFLGICLSNAKIPCTIFEKRADPVSDSRSLGIHPVSMDLFQKLEIHKPFLKSGIKIEKGIAHSGKKNIAEIDFTLLDPPFNYILAVPQFKTEYLLEEEYLKMNPNGLVRGAEITKIKQNDNQVIIQVRKNGQTTETSCDYLIGCDGKNSFVRQSASIFFGGKRYKDTYVMGDFDDNTGFDESAVVYLTPQGMIECFPLPNGMRRWVAKTDTFISSPSHKEISEIIYSGINHDLNKQRSTMLSGFGVQHFIAEKFVKKRIILCGDAAHVISPIGGQGMNLGWIGAQKLADIFKTATSYNDVSQQLTKFDKNHRKTVKKAARRAELNMFLGRKTSLQSLRNLLVKIMLSVPFRKMTTRMFAMKGL